MSINLKRQKRKANATVEALLEAAKAKLLAKLTPEQTEQARLWAIEEGHILPNEPFSTITSTKLFPGAVRFCGDPVNKATYYTARRALLADYEIFMEALKLNQEKDNIPV